VYPDEKVARFIAESFIPARLHVREQAADFKKYGERYGAQWTPAVLIVDPDGNEQHRIEGFLEKDDFLAQLKLGLAKTAFKAQRWEDAERLFREIVDRLEKTDAAPEAQYWAGVSRYKASGNAAALQETAAAFDRKYRDSTWAKKASIWKA
jgi:TolA-binding protein